MVAFIMGRDISSQAHTINMCFLHGSSSRSSSINGMLVKVAFTIEP